MAWTDEKKQEAIEAYKAGEPTPENSTELIAQIASDMEETVNGVRMILMKAGVYVKKDATAAGTAAGKTAGTAKTVRVSKDDQIAELRAAIVAKGAEADDEVLSKLTGKAAAYFTKVLSA